MTEEPNKRIEPMIENLWTLLTRSSCRLIIGLGPPICLEQSYENTRDRR